jgi:hypothetical protein
MAMLAESVDGVIGVDTHRDTLAAAAVNRLGGVLAQITTSADAAGYRRLMDFAPHAGSLPSLLGGRGDRQLRRRAGRVLAAARRASRRDGSAQAAGLPDRRQERRAGRGPGRP